MATITEDEFDEKFKPLDLQGRGGSILDHDEIPPGTPVNRVWSVVENGEDDNLYLLTGYHVVNMLGYVVTEVPWTEENELDEVLWLDRRVDATIHIENVYADGEEVTKTETVKVTRPYWLDVAPGDEVDEDEREDWAYDELFPHTGTGRSGDAGYFVEVTACEDYPDLVGQKFEWGT